MNAQVIIEDKQDNYKEVINIENITSRQHFSYIDSDGANNDIRVFDDGISVFRRADTHKTYLVLKDDGYVKIRTDEGDLKFSLKMLEFNSNNDNISIVYCLNDSTKSISIKYLGV